MKRSKTNKTIRIKAEYFEVFNSPEFTEFRKKQLPFSLKTNYWLARVFNKVEAEAKVYFQEKQKLIDQYAEKDEKGETKILANGSVFFGKKSKEFLKKFNELQQAEIDLGIRPIKLDFAEAKGEQLSMVEFGYILPFIVEEEGV